MRSEKEITAMIESIEERDDPDDEYSYLDEGEWAMLMALYWVLGENSL